MLLSCLCLLESQIDTTLPNLNLTFKNFWWNILGHSSSFAASTSSVRGEYASRKSCGERSGRCGENRQGVDVTPASWQWATGRGHCQGKEEPTEKPKGEKGGGNKWGKNSSLVWKEATKKGKEREEKEEPTPQKGWVGVHFATV